MIKSVFRQYIADTDFKSLFNTLGWNRYQGLSEFNEEIDGFSYHFRIVGQIKGFQAIVCDNAEHITASLCKRIDYKLRPYAQSYICNQYVYIEMLLYAQHYHRQLLGTL